MCLCVMADSVFLSISVDMMLLLHDYSCWDTAAVSKLPPPTGPAQKVYGCGAHPLSAQLLMAVNTICCYLIVKASIHTTKL